MDRLRARRAGAASSTVRERGDRRSVDGRIDRHDSRGGRARHSCACAPGAVSQHADQASARGRRAILLGALFPFLQVVATVRFETRRRPRGISPTDSRHRVSCSSSVGSSIAPALRRRRWSAPTLVVQSRQDNRIPPDAAERAFNLFTAYRPSTSLDRGQWPHHYGRLRRQAVFAAVCRLVRDARQTFARPVERPALTPSNREYRDRRGETDRAVRPRRRIVELPLGRDAVLHVFDKPATT